MIARFFASGAALIVLSSAAFAADVPVRAVYTKAPPAWSWEGQYIGVHGGYAWASDTVFSVANSQNITPSGGVFGFQIGYNRQLSPKWVIGYEIDLSFGSVNETGLIGGNDVPLKIDAFGTARTRLGYAHGSWLFYATAGLAWANTNIVGLAGVANFERPHIGYAVGAGIEYAFAPNWSAKLEYIFADLDETRTLIAGSQINTDLTMSTVRFGLNYRFANWRAPAASAYFTKAPVQLAGWTGPYIGAHGGYARGNFDTFSGFSESLDPKGGFGGIQSGYNWQISRNWVVGVEGDSSWGSISQNAGGINVEIDTMGTVRGRLGYAMNNVLFYGTGGLAWAHADSTTNGAVRDQFYLGWAAGGGIEYAFNARWSAKVEYLYSEFGTINDLNLGQRTASLDVSTIKLGVNYRASFLDLIGGRW